MMNWEAACQLGKIKIEMANIQRCKSLKIQSFVSLLSEQSVLSGIWLLFSAIVIEFPVSASENIWHESS